MPGIKSIYTGIYCLGLYTVRYGKRLLKRFLHLWAVPFTYLFAALAAAAKAADMFMLRGFHAAAADIGALVLSGTAYLKRMLTGKVPPPSRAVLRAALNAHRGGLSYIAGFILPLAALAVLLVTVWHYSGTELALRVEYNGNELGCVRSSAVITQAKEKTAALLNSGVTTVTNTQLESGISYSLTTASSSELCDASSLADSLLSFYTDNYTGACAVYINDTLLCTVKSENDAVNAFDRLLTERRGGNTEATISFVEDIDFKQCLMPVGHELIKTADELYDIISNVKKSAQTYTVKQGDTAADILALFGGDEQLMQQLNPGTGSLTSPGTKVVLSPAINTLSTKATYTTERSVTLAHTSVELQTELLYAGDKQVVRKGSDGEGKVTELVTYVDGVLVDTQVIRRTTVLEPVDEIVRAGVKSGNNAYVGPYTVAATSGVFIWPVVGLYTIYSWYGYRNSGFHSGIDISGGDASGSLILAAANGTVVAAGASNSGYGNRVIIDHGNGVRTLYAHCLNKSIMVSEGDYVTQGQAIARNFGPNSLGK